MAVAAYETRSAGTTTVREIVRDGGIIAVLTAVDDGHSFTVVTQMFGHGSESTEVMHRRPYTFRDAEAGMAFLAEALTSFTYLGCEIRQP
jgi:hypothetical protein